MKSKLFVITSLALIVGCAKQGPVGPEGPQGLTGTGTAGPTGATGPTGIINIRTMIDSVAPANWTSPSSGPNYYVVSDPQISVVDSDIISVAVSTSNNSSSTWYPLPFSNLLIANDNMAYSYATNSFTLLYSSTLTLPPTVTIYFKVSVTPPQLAPKKKGTPGGQFFQN